MTVFIENNTQNLYLFEIQNAGDGSQAASMRASPGETCVIPSSENHCCLTRVPVEMVTAAEIHPDELCGRGLDGYIIQSLPERQGGSVNGVVEPAGSSVDDGGILFVFG